MERLTNLSELSIPKPLSVHLVKETSVGFHSKYRTNVNLTTSVESSRKSYLFNILPNLPSELNLSDCKLIVKAKILKDEKEYGATDQISCCQALGVFMWDEVKVSW